MSKNQISKEKHNGRFYTPKFIVDNILDISGYYENNILNKHVIDNSCGDGAFLVEIVDRYCKSAINNQYSSEEIKQDLEAYIHGIELDNIECEKCICNVTKVAQKYGIENIKWDIICADALSMNSFNNKMDFVLGNPPYVRVHNLGKSVDTIKKYLFSQVGMTDLFIVFYEIGIKMLNENGVLGYITPSSFFNSVAGELLRKYLIDNNLIEKIVDLRHFQAFSATTYTTIAILKKMKKTKSIDYYLFDEKNLIPYYCESLLPNDFYFNNIFYFGKKEKLIVLKKIISNFGKSSLIVKNGYATLCDNVFIGKFDFQSNYIIPVIKASKGIIMSMVYPYDKNAKLISEEELKKEKDLYIYLQNNKKLLLERNNEKDNNRFWYAFGRSQALSDTYKEKVAINALLRDKNDIKITNAKAGVGVYSGLYILTDTIPLEEVKKVLISEEFVDYISMLGKYKSGGYYTFSSKDLQIFLNYKFAYNGGLLENDK